MRKPLEIVAGFVSVIIMGALVFFYMPDSWRVHPKLKLPEIIVSMKQEVTDKSIAIIGGCEAIICPWPYLKIGVPVSASDNVIRRIKRSRLPAECRTIVVISGIYLTALGYSPEFVVEDNAKIVRAIQEKYPEKTVHQIPVKAQIELLKDPANWRTQQAGAQWHLNNRGYKKLHRKYRHFFNP